jgi:C-5 cytosine-specific DNA methylase
VICVSPTLANRFSNLIFRLFSQANRTGGQHGKINNDLSLTFPEAIDIFEPLTATFENVTGMLRKSNVHYAQKLVAELIAREYHVRLSSKYAGLSLYSTTWMTKAETFSPLLFPIFVYATGSVLDSSHYGDPQSRKRFIIFVAKWGFAIPTCPMATHGTGPGMLPIVTTEQAIGMFEGIPPQDGLGLVQLQCGTVVEYHACNNHVYAESVKLQADKPSPTVRCSNGIEHYALKRSLTIRELACLQSFPLSFKLFGSLTAQRTLIGNAVPVKFATAVGKAVMESYGPYIPFDDDISIDPAPTVVPASGTPSPSLVRAIPFDSLPPLNRVSQPSGATTSRQDKGSRRHATLSGGAQLKNPYMKSSPN